jgi:hypothetical protein
VDEASDVCVWAFICTIHYIIHCIQTQADASAIKIRLRQKRKKKQFHASLCTKRREGVFRPRLKKY